jgi:large subunit ribosomal protein L2
LVEKVIEIIKPRDRTAFIALVAHGDTKRYILATQNMKVGDLIKTSCEIPLLPVQPSEGDAYPLGALPTSTQIHSIEAMPGEGGIFCRAAGSFATIKSMLDDRIIIQLPSNLEVSLDKNCMATVGQVSHATHKDEKLSHPVDTRDLGYRPRSGLWQRKDGYAGRKVKPPKPIKVITNEVEEKVERINYTYRNWSLTE